MLYIGLLNNINKLAKHNQQYKEINLTHRRQINFENTILRTIDEDSKVDIRKAKCKVYYNIFIRSKYLEPSSLRHWHDDNLLNDNDIFYDSFEYAKRSTHETRLLVFQFKLMHRIINTNSNLNKWKIIQNPNCTLCCDNKIDDFKHALIECPWTKDKIHIIFTDLDPEKVWVWVIYAQ